MEFKKPKIPGIDLGPEMGDMKVYPEIAGSLVFNGENDQ